MIRFLGTAADRIADLKPTKRSCAFRGRRAEKLVADVEAVSSALESTLGVLSSRRWRPAASAIVRTECMDGDRAQCR